MNGVMKMKTLLIALLLKLSVLGFGMEEVTEVENIVTAVEEYVVNNETTNETLQGEMLLVTDNVIENGTMVEAVSLDGNTNAQYGYLLDNKYKVGSIVYVEFEHDDILKEELVYVPTEYDVYETLDYKALTMFDKLY